MSEHWRVAVTTRTGRRLLVRPQRQGRGWTVSRRRGGSSRLTKQQSDHATRWAKRRRRFTDVDRVRPGGVTHVVKDHEGVVWPNRDLLAGLDRVGKAMNRRVSVVSGRRTAYQAWDLRMRYLAGRGNLAAPCCHLLGWHTWAACGKTPRSNHASGNAADCGILSGPFGTYRSIGWSPTARKWMRRFGLCLPVGGERWHVERGTTWRA